MLAEDFANIPISRLRENKGSRLSQFCFVLSSLTALSGMSLGIYMGIAHDHTLTPVHAHLNLIGWVTLFLFGLYYRIHENAQGWLAVLQVGASTVGYISMLAGLAGLLLTGLDTYLPLAIFGSVLVWLGMLTFCAVVLRTGSRT